MDSKSALPAEQFSALEQKLEVEIRNLVSVSANLSKNEDPDFGKDGTTPYEHENDLERMSNIPFECETNLDRTRFNLASLSSNSTDELERLASELQELKRLLKLEVERVEGEIDSALAGIEILTEAMSPWKSLGFRAGWDAAFAKQQAR